jgi:hypothetical protein
LGDTGPNVRVFVAKQSRQSCHCGLSVATERKKPQGSPANYVFSGWGGDASGESNPLLLTLGTSKLIKANFALVTTTNLPPVVQTVELTSGKLNFTWSAVAGQGYQVQYKTNLLQNAWANVGSVIIATNGTVAASESFGSGTQQFYRIARLP